ncbi:serpin family protein [Actinomadura sp. WMMB 499]|uniref:serpin family protein n=1 Tax=Actinomadura sp. WMMB 499 TaxID=1219491 RepID=UPI001C3F973E|nr:serpin family protein [Actinomadura sp. WMMB 499]
MIDEAVRASNELTARWARHACTGESTALSGAGLWPLLALLAAAAEGPGRAELQEAAGCDAAVADRGARELLEVLARGTAIDGAFGLWTRAGLPLEPWWLDAAPGGGSRGELGDAPAADQARLDAWVERHTHGQLKRMPVRIDRDTLMVLATALSIDTRWRRPFEDVPYRPAHGPWSGRELAGLRGGGTDVDLLSVADTPGGPVTLLRVEGEDDVDVHLCLAAPDRPPGEVLAAGVTALGGGHPVRPGTALIAGPDGPRAPGAELRTITSFDPTPVLHLYTVRFGVTAGHDLLARPGLFGLATVATDTRDGHFPRISRMPLKISQGRQDVTATFSARGFKAAAVTAFAAVAGAAPPQGKAPMLDVAFDRPFGFLARHRPTGLVLLAGWVADPDPWPEDGGEQPW